MINSKRFRYVFVLIMLFSSHFLYAKDITSPSFIIRDPIIGTGGGYSSSGSFKLFGGGDTTLTGVGSSPTYIGHYGFFYFPLVGTVISTDSAGGGGTQSGVRFYGFAYPKAKITALQGSTEIGTYTADESGKFSIILPGNATNLFSLFATDINKRKSTLLNFPTVLRTGYLVDITGIKFAPTITSDKLAVKKGDNITIEGSALPNTSLEILVEGPNNSVFTLLSDNVGQYKTTSPLFVPEGEYNIRSHYPEDDRFSKVLRLVVGKSNISRSDATINIPGDCNVDSRIDLSDFSMLAYWFGKPNPPSCVDTNADKKIDLIDFSILAFYWNG